MLKLMITAASSGSGKTAVTCGLLSLLKERGLEPAAFKCGPDYIDPMFHRSVLGIPTSNLDVFLAGEKGVRQAFYRGCRGAGAAVCEGVMGYYDGQRTDSARASAWHVGEILDLPAILVIRPKGAALTLAAVIRGMADFRRPSRIRGVIFNDCSEMYCRVYGPVIERESGIPVLGYLPHMEEAAFESRHLGLMTAEEITDLGDRIHRIGARMEETVDIDRLLRIAGAGASRSDAPAGEGGQTEKDLSDETGLAVEDDRMNETEQKEDDLSDRKDLSDKTGQPDEMGLPDRAGRSDKADSPVRIAVARDAAFNFIYTESLAAMEEAGARIVFFSPLEDRNLPEGVSGLYLPGGYPELYGRQLAENESMRTSIREAVSGGLPTIAECGGFLYLGETLEDGEGRAWPMAGALPGRAAGTGRLVRFGYGLVSCREDSMLFKTGEEVPVHEFHYWDTSAQGTDLTLTKNSNGKTWRFGYANGSLYAGFPHLYLAGGPAKAGPGPEETLAWRFTEEARRYAFSHSL